MTAAIKLKIRLAHHYVRQKILCIVVAGTLAWLAVEEGRKKGGTLLTHMITSSFRSPPS
jgi:hypothetical protein